MGKTLTLSLKKKWFDMIASGEKTEEYRAIKRDYEMLVFRRFLVGKGVDPLAYPRGFTHVRFHLGYTKITMTFEIDSITFGKGKEEWGAGGDLISVGGSLAAFKKALEKW